MEGDVTKSAISDLARFGGPVLFDEPKSTSNLVTPSFEAFLRYSRVFYQAGKYTNNGPLVRQVEERLAAFHQTSHCIAFCSGFWALACAIQVLRLPGRSELLMPSLTYRRMADIAAWVGLKPRFCEVDPETLAISAKTAAPCLNDETALIMAVHPIVNFCDVVGLEALSSGSGVPLLIDSVESVYETLPQGKIGGFGRAEVFSLHASKLINGGEGGYVTTNDDLLAQQLNLMRGFGFHGQDHVIEPGAMNAKLNEIHAAMTLASLDDLEEQIQRNRATYRLYQELLTPLQGVRLVEFDERQKTSYKNIVVELTSLWPLSRKQTIAVLNAEQILARTYYSPPLHRKPMQYPHVQAHLPDTDALAARFMLMPCGAMVDEHDIRKVVSLLVFMQGQAAEIKRAFSASEEA